MSQNPAVTSAYLQHRSRILARNNHPPNGKPVGPGTSVTSPTGQQQHAHTPNYNSLNSPQPSMLVPHSTSSLSNDFKSMSLNSNSKYQPLENNSTTGIANGYVQQAMQLRDAGNRGNYSSPTPSTQGGGRIPEDPIYANLGKTTKAVSGNPPQYSPPAPPPYDAFHNKIVGGTGIALPNYHHLQTGENSIASSRSSPSLYSGSITLNKSVYSNSTLENDSECPIYENLDTLQQSSSHIHTHHDNRNVYKSSVGHLDSQYIYAPLSDTGSSVSLANSNSSKACPQVPVKRFVPSSVGRVVAHSETVLNRGHLYAEIPAVNQFKPIHSSPGGATSPSPYAVTNVMTKGNSQLRGAPMTTHTQQLKEAPKTGQQPKNARKLLPSITLHKTNVSF